MKNTILKVVQQNDFDRYVFLTYLNDEIVGLNFWQGIGKESYESVMNDKGYQPCIHLTDIYNRLKRNDKTATDEQRINKAIHLYINAFIIQEDETFLGNLKGSKNEHLAFLNGFSDAWNKAVETDTTEEFMSGASTLFVAYCTLHNLPIVSADELIYELNKI